MEDGVNLTAFVPFPRFTLSCFILPCIGKDSWSSLYVFLKGFQFSHDILDVTRERVRNGVHHMSHGLYGVAADESDGLIDSSFDK